MMKNMFILACMAMVAALGFSVAACSSDDEPDSKLSSYAWGVNKVREDYMGEMNTQPETRAWVEGTLKLIEPQTTGKGSFADDSQMQTVKTNAENALNKAIADFLEAQKHYDFGDGSYSACYEFETYKDEKPLFPAQSFIFEYQGYDRFESSFVFDEPNFSKKISLANKINLKRNITWSEFDMANDLTDIIISGNVRVFNSQTRQIYTGPSFVKSIQVGEESDGLNVNLEFEKAHGQEYLGSWYLLIPISLKDAGETMVELKVCVNLM